MATLTEQLDAMLTLPENWDGYGAAPIRPGPVEFGKEFVRLLSALRQGTHNEDGVFVTPSRDGGVLIEWDDATAEHELEINPDGSLGFLHEDKSTGVMTTRTFLPEPVGVQPGFLTELRSLIAA
jgi:hypothetical protein